ncbi:phage minor head protein [Sphingobacterium sp. UT-1RO-CII-1]|uniref:phage minor head protein n=1 Tax=Sphingobacterium sp. UT-1RO-CII-1 TaxID=2995225 RepID=UPI00227A4D0A|nr:phage minor head protein [Sphingobacterium sp. UT-1RO-CII-1]MCY4781701.1 phage minor head protein [Sphingobacterium sp. UT-1RO-CII-1]
MTPKQVHKQFLRRHGIYERRYARLFLDILRKQYKEAAEQYPAAYTVNPEDYRQAITALYLTVLPCEAEQAFNIFVKPLAGEQKDFFDDLMSILGIPRGDGEWIRIWRDTAREWMSLNILTKIQNIATTTQRAIAKVIEDKLNQPEGTSIAEIRHHIQQASNGEVNKHRAVVIARTETLAAMNKGTRLSMYSSGLEYSKKWLDTPDKRTRLSHRAIAQEEWRGMDDAYWLVNKLGVLEAGYYPGDPLYSAENVIQCRCCEMYEVVRDAAGRPVRRHNPVDVSELANII